MSRYLSESDVSTIRAYARGMSQPDDFGRFDTDLSDDDARAVADALYRVADARDADAIRTIDDGVDTIYSARAEGVLAESPHIIDDDGNTVASRAALTLRNMFGA